MLLERDDLLRASLLVWRCHINPFCESDTPERKREEGGEEEEEEEEDSFLTGLICFEIPFSPFYAKNRSVKGGVPEK